MWESRLGRACGDRVAWPLQAHVCIAKVLPRPELSCGSNDGKHVCRRGGPFDSLVDCLGMKADVRRDDREIGYTNSRFVCVVI